MGMNTTIQTWSAEHIPTLEDVVEAIRFEQLSVRVFGRTLPQPRLVCWYGPQSYTYSGLTLPALAAPSVINALCRKASAAAGVVFNSVMCNLYRDGSDSVGWHSDDEPEFGNDPVIASLSIGSPRRFLMRRNDRSDSREFSLGHGDLLVMGSGVQAAWQHSVPKTRKPVGARINLTFRRIV